MINIDEDLKQPIFHLTLGDLSQNNVEILENIQSSTDIELTNRLLAQAYLFLNTYSKNCLDFAKMQFNCLHCKGCRASYEDCDSKYCMHANDCELAKFVETLEKSFKVEES